MKNLIKTAVMGVGSGALAVLLLAPISFAQSVPSTPSASDLLAAVNTLQTIDAARANVAEQINLQLAQVTMEVQNLVSEPRNTPNEQAAFMAELGAIATKLSQLSASAEALNQIQATENAMFASLQASMRALGLQ